MEPSPAPRPSPPLPEDTVSQHTADIYIYTYNESILSIHSVRNPGNEKVPFD